MEKRALTYTLEIEPHDDGYLAHFPALPGCHTWGKTYEAAVKHAEEALIGFFGVEGVPVEHSTAPKAVACVKTGSCDVAVMGIEPSRAAEVDFTPPLIEIDYTF